jgi:MAP3K12-binding inhibitory protein 1
VDERLENIEKHMKLFEGGEKPVPKDIYARLKTIEEKILFLEGVSPEYFSCLVIGLLINTPY